MQQVVKGREHYAKTSDQETGTKNKENKRKTSVKRETKNLNEKRREKEVLRAPEKTIDFFLSKVGI